MRTKDHKFKSTRNHVRFAKMFRIYKRKYHLRTIYVLILYLPYVKVNIIRIYAITIYHNDNNQRY